MTTVLRIVITIASALLLCFCQSNRRYTATSAKTVGQNDNVTTEVNTVAYHINDSVTRIFLEIRNDNLLYKRPDTTSAFYAGLRISYKLANEISPRQVADSGSYFLYDRAENEYMQARSLFSRFDLSAYAGNNYDLEVEVFDLNRKARYTRELYVQKLNTWNEQNMLVTIRDSVVFKDHFYANEKVGVRSELLARVQVTVDCFLKEYGPAPPPFSTRRQEEFEYRPDSVFLTGFTNGRLELTMPKKGFYHIRTHNLSKDGLTLFTYEKTYPGVGSSEEMINCTRYIMSREEFDECKSAADQKAAIDRFWLGIGGSNERARELIRRYYNRVKEANKIYESYTEGWKSDRGMIFIVFGPPANIYHSRRDEIWVYGNEANPGALRFVFNKIKSPFSDNEYVMERSQFYKDPWHSAVDYWRQGNIYIDTRR